MNDEIMNDLTIFYWDSVKDTTNLTQISARATGNSVGIGPGTSTSTDL